MSDRTAKHGKKDRSAPGLPPAALLGPRLNRLWSDPAWLRRDDAEAHAELDTVCKGVSSAKLIGMLLKAHQAAPEPAQARLAQLVPVWLRRREHLPALREAVERAAVAGPDRDLAVAWLQAAGEETTALTQAQQPDTFFDAYFYGDRSQATLSIFWFRDRQRTQVQGINFLLDSNPPWDGAIKDIIALPRQDPRAAVRDHVQRWTSEGMPMQRISAVEAKRRILAALACNRKGNIRLPADLIASRADFIRYVLPLPDGPETLPFTETDFAALIHAGQRPEEIVHFEQTVGRRVRMADGKELVIMGGGLDDEW